MKFDTLRNAFSYQNSVYESWKNRINTAIQTTEYVTVIFFDVATNAINKQLDDDEL